MDKAYIVMLILHASSSHAHERIQDHGDMRQTEAGWQWGGEVSPPRSRKQIVAFDDWAI